MIVFIFFSQKMEYVQRRLVTMEDAGRPSSGVPSGTELHSLLFHPIAGDSTHIRNQDTGTTGMPSLLSLKQLQFGLLDNTTMLDLSVATITNANCSTGLGCLNDLRMGANPNGKPCQTCGQQHHDQGIFMSKCHGTNCPGHFGRIGLPHAVINPLFVGLLTVVLQTVCMNCQRLRISPYYLQAAFPMKSRSLHRLKAIGALCSRQTFCQFCQAMVLSFKQQGISIMARPTLLDGAALVMVPANIIFSVLVRLPDIDIAALGFGSHNHPCNTILSTVLVLPPVSRPAMRTVNLKTGNPFVPNRLHSAPAGAMQPFASSGGQHHDRVPGHHSGGQCIAKCQ